MNVIFVVIVSFLYPLRLRCQLVCTRHIHWLGEPCFWIQRFLFVTRFVFEAYLPVLVIIISVPRSWKRSHSSLVSRWHWTGFKSSQLHDPTILGALGAGSGEERSPSMSLAGDWGGVERPTLEAVLVFRRVWDTFPVLLVLHVELFRRRALDGGSSESLQSTTSTSTSSSMEMGPAGAKTKQKTE